MVYVFIFYHYYVSDKKDRDSCMIFIFSLELFK